MKNIQLNMRRSYAGMLPATYSLGVLILFAFTLSSCDKNAEQKAMDPTLAANQNSTKSLTITSPLLGNIDETILVANSQSLGAEKTDPLLVDPWGLAIGDDNTFWIASNHKGLALVYGADGHQQRKPIDIPLNGVHFGSAPSGVVRNNSGGFVIPGTRQSSQYIFATEDGIIAAYGGGDTTVTVADRSSTGAVYKGLAIAQNGGTEYIYVANFHNGNVDVFDQSFNYVSNINFVDANIPKGFAPFNIKNINGKLFVTYAMQKPGTGDDQAGIGNGYINVFNPNGSLAMHFAAKGLLNSPWGMVETETQGRAEHLLVGNFGDGHINVFDMQGNYTGQLGAGGNALSIPGLWALAFKDGDEKEFENSGETALYFTAGPAAESEGLFGYLTKAITKTNPTTVTVPAVNNNLVPPNGLHPVSVFK